MRDPIDIRSPADEDWVTGVFHVPTCVEEGTSDVSHGIGVAALTYAGDMMPSFRSGP